MASTRFFCCFRFRPLTNVWTPLLIRSHHETKEMRNIVAEYKKIRSLTPEILYSADRKAGAGNTSEMWKNAPETEKAVYQSQYETSISNYFENLYEYLKQIPDVSKFNEKEQKLFKRALYLQKKKLDKPERPLNDYFLYVKDCYHKHSNLTEVGKAWLNLDDSIRKKYQEAAKESWTKYMELLRKWEEEMLRQGHDLLVRKKIRDEYLKKNE